MTQSVKEERQFRLSSRRLWKELLEVFHEIGCRAEKLRDLRLDVPGWVSRLAGIPARLLGRTCRFLAVRRIAS